MSHAMNIELPVETCEIKERLHFARMVAGIVVLHALTLAAQNLRIEEHAVLAGGSVKVPVLVSDATGLASASLTINYDAQVLALESLTNGSLGQTFSLEYRTSEGQARIVAVRDTAVAGGSGALVIMNFRANAGAVPGMISPITFADRGLGGQYGRDFAWSQAVSHTNGLVRIVSEADDTNQNGLPDYWEELYFGGPTKADPAADDDGDGMTNVQEFLAGTNPLDANSVLRIDSILRTPGGLEIQFPSVSGKTYRIEYSSDLQTWAALPTNIPGTGGAIRLSIADPSSASWMFYRLELIR